MWGDFLKPGADPRNYEEARDPKAMLKLMDDYLGTRCVGFKPRWEQCDSFKMGGLVIMSNIFVIAIRFSLHST